MVFSQKVTVLDNSMKIRPVVTTAQLMNIADKYFGMMLKTDTVPVELNSYDDRNFLLHGTMRPRGNELDAIYKNHNKFILKIFNASQLSSKAWHENVNQVLLSCFESCSNSFKVPYPFQALSGNQQSVAECKIPLSDDAVYESCTLNDLIEKGLLDEVNGEIVAHHIVRLTVYIPGKVINMDTMNRKLAYNWGSSTALLSEAMKGQAEPELIRSKWVWNLLVTPKILRNPYINSLKDENRKKVLLKILDKFQNDVVPILQRSLTKQWIHGDLNGQNMLACDNNIVGIIDFDDAAYSYRIIEIATALMYVTCGSNTDNIIENAKNMFRGYSSIIQLNKIEMKALYTTMLVRYVQSLAMSEYQYLYVDPGNEYLLITQKAAWKNLEELLRIGSENFMKGISITM